MAKARKGTDAARSTFPPTSILQMPLAEDEPSETVEAESVVSPPNGSPATGLPATPSIIPDTREEESHTSGDPFGAQAVEVQDGSAALIAKYGNKSNAIRALYADGVTYAAIAKALGIRYQHVRNVLDQPQKRKLKAERDAKRNLGD